MESQQNKPFSAKHDKMSSLSENTLHKPLNARTQSKHTSFVHRASGPLHLTNPAEAKKIEATYKSLSFSLNLKDLNLAEQPQITVYVFSNPHIQDVFEWRRELRFLAVTNEWADEASKTILNLPITDEFRTQIESKRTFDSKLDALCEAVYNGNQFNTYRNLLTNAKRCSFNDFETFFFFLDKVRARADLCLKKKAPMVIKYRKEM
ncbi:hypothetical protein NGRA_3301 [Nosema granulosis]|uniref:Uncharacterized protein n=1 Tax=Nosema granulosis TaxID=83296 RepID=A0A9P6GXL8_9MICR|nr:hypothetical protein NGRA_3301 [Nosema granulosis]